MPLFPTVLVVDDSPVDRQLVGGLLQKDPFLRVRYAANGQDALEKIASKPPEIVLTDLVMPEMDGLDFVRAVMDKYSVLPVVLMTAHGSGEIAAKALELGATSYIPKAQLAQRVLGTVQRLLGTIRRQYSYERLAEFQTRCEYSFSIENKDSLIDPLIGLVHESAASVHFSDGPGRLQLIVALEQALLNAIYHGNLEYVRQSARAYGDHATDDQSKDDNTIEIGQSHVAGPGQPRLSHMQRRVHIDIRITPQEARFRVRDEGAGFDVATIAELSVDAAVERDGGQGIVLMRTLMDEVRFNETGNEVVMVKRCDRPLAA